MFRTKSANTRPTSEIRTQLEIKCNINISIKNSNLKSQETPKKVN